MSPSVRGDDDDDGQASDHLVTNTDFSSVYPTFFIGKRTDTHMKFSVIPT